MKIKLTDLDAVLKPSALRFRCPKHGDHQIRFTFSGWTQHGSRGLEDITVVPSVLVRAPDNCGHWNVKDGYLEDA